MKKYRHYGRTLTCREWAERVGVTSLLMSTRLNCHHDPLIGGGRFKPDPTDKKNNPKRYWDDFFRWKGVE